MTSITTEIYEYHGFEKYPVVEVDTQPGVGRIRIYLNDCCIYDGDPEVDDRNDGHVRAIQRSY